MNRKKMMLKRIEEIRELKESMTGSYFWNPPFSSNQRESYGLKRTYENIIIHGVDVFTSCSCSCKNIYFESTTTNNLKLAEILIRFSSLKELKKSDAEKRFKRFKNPNNYSFSQVWNNLKKVANKFHRVEEIVKKVNIAIA